MDEMRSIDEVLNAPEHKNSFFAIMRDGECVAVMITPDLFEELKQIKEPNGDYFTIYQRGEQIGWVSNDMTMPEEESNAPEEDAVQGSPDG